MRRLATIFFVIAAALCAAGPALAQDSGKVWRLGVLTLPTSTSSPVFQSFRSIVFPELAKQGYVEGGNLVVETRSGAARRIAALARSKRLEATSLAEMEKAATQAGLELLTFYAGTPEDFPAAFAKMREARTEALAIASVPEFAGNAAALASQALASHLPTVCEWDWMAQEGCLLGYGPDFAELRRRTADYVVRIFRGASPGELPMEQPTHYKFTINLNTAKALGLTMPPAILARADEVIE